MDYRFQYDIQLFYFGKHCGLWILLLRIQLLMIAVFRVICNCKKKIFVEKQE